MAVATALALAGCGGGDDSATTITGPGGSTATVRTDNLSSQQKKRLDQLRSRAEQLKREAKQQGGSSGGDSTAPVPFREPTGSAPTGSGSLPNEGTRRVAPGVPTAKGGDNSIQEFGVEGPADDRVQAAVVFQAYLNARLAGDWSLGLLLSLQLDEEAA